MAKSVWEALRRALEPVEERPRIVPRIEAARYTTRAGTPYVVIHNPTAQTYARLDPRELDLLELFDGRHTIGELVIAYYQRHGVLALARVVGLVQLLRAERFLSEGHIDAYTRLARQLRAPVRQLRAAELTWSKADIVLERWYRAWGHVFFRPMWLWLGVIAGFIGAVVVLFELGRGRFVLYEAKNSALLTIVLLVALAWVTLAAHELGRGLAVKNAKRTVHRAGVRLYLGLPAVYVDTTDICMAAPHDRLLTSFVGPWTALMLGAVCALGAELAPDGAVGTFLFTAAFVLVIHNVFYFSPLLELDGYDILIGLMDTPLLRARALAFILGPLWRKLRRGEPLAREERLFALFGVASVLYRVLAVVVALRVWQALALPMIGAGWQSGDLLPRLGVLLLIAAIAVPLGLWLIAVARQLASVSGWLVSLGDRARTHRHREAQAALRTVPLWSELPPARLLELARRMRVEHVVSGVEVVRQGEPGDRLYVIDDGVFELLVDGEPMVRLGRGDYFGERALLSETPVSATVLAVEAGRVFVLDRSAFDGWLATDLEARARLEAALANRSEVGAMPLFRDLAPTELDVLLGHMKPQAVTRGETIVRHGEPGWRMYVVRSGCVAIERGGGPQATLRAGGAFGEVALLRDVLRTATVVAQEPSELLSLEAHDFRAVLADYLGQAGELQRLSHLQLGGQ